MRRLHIEAAYGGARVPNGLGERIPISKFVALVAGDTKPDPAVERALRSTGGTWENRVSWAALRQAYLVVGRFDDDPNYGDNPQQLDCRLRRAVGDWGISLRVHAHGVLVYEGGALAARAPSLTTLLN